MNKPDRMTPHRVVSLINVNERLVYTNHGPVLITRSDEKDALGQKLKGWYVENWQGQEIFVVDSPSNIKKFRPLCDPSDIERACKQLNQQVESKGKTTTWARKEKELNERVATNNFAELVNALAATSQKPETAMSENWKRVHAKLLAWFVTEVAWVRGCTVDESLVYLNKKTGKMFKLPQSIEKSKRLGAVTSPLEATTLVRRPPRAPSAERTKTEKRNNSPATAVLRSEQEAAGYQVPTEVTPPQPVPKSPVIPTMKRRASPTANPPKKPWASDHKSTNVGPKTSRPKPNENTQATIGGVGVVKSQADKTIAGLKRQLDDSVALIAKKDATIAHLRRLLENTVKEQDNLRQIIMKPTEALDEKTQAEIRHLQWVVEERGKALKRQADINNRLMQRNIELTKEVQRLEEVLKKK